jgi:hypothetical protein
LLSELDEAKQKEIAQFVRERVYQSWQNGVEHGQNGAKLDHLEKSLNQTGKRFAGKQRS